MVTLLDIQGFDYKNKSFICKEIAIFNVESGKHVHKIVKIPFSTNWMETNVYNHMKWMSNELHGLEWSDDDSNPKDVVTKCLKKDDIFLNKPKSL